MSKPYVESMGARTAITLVCCAVIIVQFAVMPLLEQFGFPPGRHMNTAELAIVVLPIIQYFFQKHEEKKAATGGPGGAR